MSKNRFVATALVMAIAMYSVGCTSDSDTNDIQATSMTADEFTELFAEDEEKAETNNKDKFFEITGEYAGDLLDSTIVIDTSVVYGDYSDCELRFKISADEFSKVPELEEGDNITLKAEFKSVTAYTLNFDDAIYVSSEKAGDDSYEADTTATTTVQTTTVTEAPAQTTTTDAQASAAVLEFVSVPDKVYRNQDATVTIKGKPNTEYNIFVYYSSGYSEADGLENKISDSNGNVTWTWHVGGSTGLGDNKRITVTGGDESITSYFEVLDSE